MVVNNQTNILIITPTLFKNFDTLSRCIKSVENQILTEDIKIYHLIIYDGFENDIPEEIFKYKDTYRDIVATNEEKSNTWGAYARQFGLDIINNTFGFFGDTLFEYVLFLDDDNYLFPEYTIEMYNKIIKENSEAAICKIYHHGPINDQYLPHLKCVNAYESAIAIISGNPPELYNIDTLNVMFKMEVWKNNTWTSEKGHEGYFNDGITYQRVLKNTKNVFVNKILAIHY